MQKAHTPADAVHRRSVTCAEVARQTLGVVAGPRTAAVLIELSRTDQAAAALVRHQGHPRCTALGRTAAPALPGARGHLQDGGRKGTF